MSTVPSKYQKLEVHTKSTSFKDATRIVSVPFPSDLPPNSVVIKIKYAGVNASDINYTAGKYRPGVKVPFDVGFEGIGTIVAVSSKNNSPPKYSVGQFVALSAYGCYSEYLVVPEKIVIPIPSLSKEILPILVSGLTASIALERVGELSSNETVLVTAAAGGTGQFAVQLARLKGNHVIGTCSSDEKIPFLQKLGCHRVINYKKENLDQVLKKEYPKGIDIVYESVGGDMFNTLVKHLAVRGRLIIIGMISGYESGSAWSKSDSSSSPLSATLLTKSASVRGFFLFHFRQDWAPHLLQLLNLWQNKEIQSSVDDKEFVGLDSIDSAVQHLYSGKNKGKVVVTIETSKL